MATSLAEPAEHVVLQVLHEEVHPITDPVVLAERRGPRATTRGEPGWALHEELERVAVAATATFLEARAPAWLPAFARWRERLARPHAPGRSATHHAS